MRRIVPIATLLLAAVALSSCYWRPNFDSGGLSLDVSSFAPKAIGDVVRVYLIVDGLLFSTGGGVPFAAEISGEDYSTKTISIEGLPVGPIYKAMVGWGPVSGGIFQPQFYGESVQFTVMPNANTPVDVWTESIDYPYGYVSSYSPDLLGHELTGVVEDDNGSMNAAEASRLHFFNFSPPDSWNITESLDLGYRVYSLSRGIPLSGLGIVGTYLDTERGILPFINSDGWDIDTSFSAALGGSKDIRGSGSFDLNVSGFTDYAIFFRRGSGLGGAYVAQDTFFYSYPSPTLWNWVNRDFPGVTDMVVSRYNAYYAAGGSVFALAPAYLRDPALAANRINLPIPAHVQSLGFRPYISGSPGGTLYMGTTDGVWQMDVNESTSTPYVTPASSPIQAAAAGDSIERIAINANTTYHEAYLSRYYLYIVKSGYPYKIPFFAVVPGRATGMAWDNSWNLYVSGTEGLSAIYAGS